MPGVSTVPSIIGDFGSRLARNQERMESRVSELVSERDTFKTLYELSTIIDAERDLHLRSVDGDAAVRIEPAD